MNSNLLSKTLLAITLLTSAVSYGQESYTKSRPLIRQPGHAPAGDLDITAYLTSVTFYGAGIGGMAGYRIIKHGFIPPINNSVSLEGGLMLITSCGFGSCMVWSGDMRWDFHVHPLWTVYGAAGLNIIQLESSSRGHYFGTDVDLDSKLGAFFRFNKDLLLRLEYAPAVYSHRVGLTWVL